MKYDFELFLTKAERISRDLRRPLRSEEIDFINNAHLFPGQSGCLGCFMGEHEFPAICENALKLKEEYRLSLENFLYDGLLM